MPEVVEVPWPRMRIASHGVGHKKQTEHFCYISTQKDDVNLGFYYCAKLPDPHGLLEGAGSSSGMSKSGKQRRFVILPCGKC
jgi:hypothetical protein